MHTACIWMAASHPRRCAWVRLR